MSDDRDVGSAPARGLRTGRLSRGGEESRRLPDGRDPRKRGPRPVIVPEEGRAQRYLDRAAAWIVAATVALAPLPFGSAEPGWIAGWCLLLSLAALLSDPRRLTAAHMAILVPVFVTATIFALFVGLQSVDGLPVPRNDIWERAEEVLGRPLGGAVSVNAAGTWLALGMPILVFLSFCAAFIASTKRSHARLITRAALYSGAAFALFGIFQAILDPTALLWAEKLAYVGDLTGPFVNRNTAATYFGCCLILWSNRVVSELFEDATSSARGLEGVRTSIFDHLHPAMAINLFCTFCCLTALLLTHSRAGIVLSFLALFVTLALQVRVHLSGRSSWIMACAVLLVAAVVLLEMLGGGIALRITEQGLIDPERLRVYRASLEIVGDFPLFGTGFGTFADVFPVYRLKEMASTGLWEKAHNVPLELATDLGIPMAVLIVLLWIAGLGQLLRRSFGRARRGLTFTIAGFGIGLLGCLHALVDFSPQVAGFAVFWMALLGCGLAQSISAKDKPAAFKGYDRAASSPGMAAAVAADR